MANIINDLEAKLPKVSSIPESGVSGIYNIVARELERWAGKKESDASMLDTLRDYWASVGWSWWDGDTDIPWSAAFISYVLGDDFPGSSAHRKYVEKIIDGEAPNWRAYSIPKNIDLIELRPGDVLVKPRSGNYSNSHGAVVMDVTDGVASLAGGNVSNTAKVESKIKTDSTGKIVSGLGSFAIVLKRISDSPDLEGQKKFPIAALGAAVLLFLIVRG